MNFHRSVAVLIKFLQLHKFIFGNDGHSPCTVFWNHQLLLKHSQMLRGLHELQPNLAFKQTQLREVIAVLTKRHPHGRFNDQTSCKDIITTGR